MDDKVLAAKHNKKKLGSVTQKGTIGNSESKDVAANDDLIIGDLKDEVIRNLARGNLKGEKFATKKSKSGSGFKIAGGKSGDVAASDDLIIAALNDEEIRKVVGGRSKGEISAAKKRKSSGGFKIASGKSKHVDANDDLIIAVLKDEEIRKLVGGKSMGENTGSKKSKSGGIAGGNSEDVAVNDDLIIAALTDEEIRKLAGSKSKGEKSPAEKNKAGDGFKIIKGAQGVELDNVKKENEENVKTPVKRKRGADGEILQAFMSSPERNSSRLRPRKEVAAFRMVDLGENNNDRIVGKRVKVYWSESRKWFTGRIRAFDYKKRLHKVLYDDGDKEELDLRKERFELEIMPSEGFNLITEFNSGKKVKSLDSGQGNTETLWEDSMVGDDEKVMKGYKRKKKKIAKKAAKRGSSRSLKKKDPEVKKAEDLVAKMDVDVLPEEFDKVTTDEICYAKEAGDASSEEEHDESKSILKKATETIEARVSGQESNSEVKEIEAGDSEESGEAVKEDIIKVSGTETVKRQLSLKKKRTPRTAKGKDLKSNSRRESTEGQNLNGNMEVDVLHDQVKTVTILGDINVEGIEEVNHQKDNKNTEALAKQSSERNDGMSEEAQCSKPDFREKKEIGLDEAKVSCLEDYIEDLAADVEAATRLEKVKDKMISREINVEGPGDVNTMKNNDETESLKKAVSEEACEVSNDLPSAILSNSEKENPEILQWGLNNENRESEEYTSEEVEKNCLSEEGKKKIGQGLQQLDDNPKVDLTSEITVEARNSESSGNIEVIMKPVRRPWSMVQKNIITGVEDVKSTFEPHDFNLD